MLGAKPPSSPTLTAMRKKDDSYINNNYKQVKSAVNMFRREGGGGRVGTTICVRYMHGVSFLTFQVGDEILFIV